MNLGIIGNCTVGALIDESAAIVWACLPHFDGDPVFCALLDTDGDEVRRGACRLDVLDRASFEQSYVANTAILRTRIVDRQGGTVQITDFAPRFRQFGRTFCPSMLVRIIEPLAGAPRLRLALEPRFDYGEHEPHITSGSHHIRYVGPSLTVRVTTDASITSILEQIPVVVDHRITLIIGPDESLQENVEELGQRFYAETRSYWLEWVRYLNIPFEWQEAVIRSAITLKLNAFDDTGAIVAAMTTSIPESPHSGRNWDYRYCWLRDGYFVVNALNRLSTTHTMERYLRYIINIIANRNGETLQPVYRISGASDIEERTVASLAGYHGMGPVRIGNDAYRQTQNDVYGSAILACMHVFYDRRLERPGDAALFRRLEPLGEIAARVYAQPDAGLWELRGSQHVHTFSAVMCWVACDRLARIAGTLGIETAARYWRQHATAMHAHIRAAAWNEQRNTFVSTFGGDALDASLLLLPSLGFVNAADPAFAATLGAVERNLLRDGFVFRYVDDDDFGAPQYSFAVCNFWYVEALAAVGRMDEARAMFETLLALRSPLGLLGEHIDPRSRALWGNFPQTYSMVGLINCAVQLSKSWEDAF